jgi:hypothetical protein
MAKFGFDTSEVDVNEQGGGGNYDPLPEGEYTLKAVEAVEKVTKAGNGNYINVKFEVVKGEFAGRLLWNIFNINNPSETAQRIGRQQAVAWATACGKPDCDDTDKLLDKSFKAAVSIQPAKDGYAASNRIKAFLFDSSASADEKPRAAAKPAAKAAATAAPAAKAANPWD